MSTSRIFQPKDVPLFRTPIQTCGANAGGNIFFVIPTPAARLLTKVAFFFWPSLTGQGQAMQSPPAATIDFTQAGAIGNILLNLYTAEQAETGWWIPTGDLVGTLVGLAGQAIPAPAPSLGLAGFSLDVQAGQGGIGGILQIPATAGYNAPGRTGYTLSLRVRYEAQGTEICEDEWQDLRSRLQIQAPSPLVFI